MSMIPHLCLDALSCHEEVRHKLDGESALTPSLGRRVGPRSRLATMPFALSQGRSRGRWNRKRIGIVLGYLVWETGRSFDICVTR
ncbi:hypothetical protein QBC47DRAFT_368839 [Echria macrotheca]|uniref:Uncharacterized protein n=1 Tax=Echria macrotheca TaxID=438768 RepID=A0AAJ0BMI1_9PEZI|nr:hypothetical protein QBC47DRAFT_368839 [Echria macrotheca]